MLDNRHEMRWVGLGAAAAMLCALIPCIFNDRPYFQDDAETYSMPTYVAIGHALWRGEFPLLTLQNYFGGNLAAESQFGLFNPVSLLTYLLLAPSKDLVTWSTILAVFYYGVLGSGTFVLARSCGATHLAALLAAITLATNNLIYYWLASNWLGGLASLAWLSWAAACLLRCHERRLWWGGAVVFTALTLSLGYSHADVALGLLCAILALVRYRDGGWRNAVPAASAAVLGGILVIDAALPLLSTTAVTSRQMEVLNDGFAVPNLLGVLSVSSPFHFGIMRNFRDDIFVRSPIFFAGWYLLPALPLIDWSRVEWRRSSFRVLVFFAAIALLATQGPALLGPIQSPFRYIPFLHFAVAVIFAVAVSEGGLGMNSRKRMVAALAIIALGAITSLQAQPSAWFPVLYGAGVGALGILALAGSHRPSARVQIAVLVAITVLFCAFTRLGIPRNPNVSSLISPREIAKVVDLGAVPASYSMYLGGFPQPGELAEYSFGQIGLVRGISQVAGYSPLKHRGLSTLLCMEVHGTVCPGGGARLLERDPVTGLTMAELMRVTEIVVHKGPHLDAVEPLLGAQWWRGREGQYTVTYRRQTTHTTEPGTVAWSSPGVSILQSALTTPTEERLSISLPSGQGGMVIFARLAWPGYRAELAGRAVPVLPYRDTLVSVSLPPGSSGGELVLRYAPPLFEEGLAASAAALVLVGILLLYWPALFAVEGAVMRPEKQKPDRKSGREIRR